MLFDGFVEYLLQVGGVGCFVFGDVVVQCFDDCVGDIWFEVGCQQCVFEFDLGVVVDGFVGKYVVQCVFE